jgi:hypothetical protein
MLVPNGRLVDGMIEGFPCVERGRLLVHGGREPLYSTLKTPSIFTVYPFKMTKIQPEVINILLINELHCFRI